METIAVVMPGPGQLALSRLPLDAPGDDDVVVRVAWSGISTGTERLLWTGAMPDFPGMGYPLVPGYESIGTVVHAGPTSGRRPGQRVFVPGARCYGAVRGLFGAASAHLVVPGVRTAPIESDLGERGVLLALAATAMHALGPPGSAGPDLIVGHGVLGRLLARIAMIDGGDPPTVWERDPARFDGATGYRVVLPEHDERRDYRAIYDVSGDAGLLDELVSRLAPGGEIVLAGFYPDRVGFAFAPAFMREARLRIAAQWRADDLRATLEMMETGLLSLDGLITHRAAAGDAARAYVTAFTDPGCLKMVLDWREIT